MFLFRNLDTELLSSVQSQASYVLPLLGLGVCLCGTLPVWHTSCTDFSPLLVLLAALADFPVPPAPHGTLFFRACLLPVLGRARSLSYLPISEAWEGE